MKHASFIEVEAVCWWWCLQNEANRSRETMAVMQKSGPEGEYATWRRCIEIDEDEWVPSEIESGTEIDWWLTPKLHKTMPKRIVEWPVMVPTRISRSTGGAASQETELILEDVAVKTKTLRRLEERCAWRQARRWAPVCLESRRRQRRRTSCGSVLASLNLNSKPECKNWGGRWRTETKRLKF